MSLLTEGQYACLEAMLVDGRWDEIKGCLAAWLPPPDEIPGRVAPAAERAGGTATYEQMKLARRRGPRPQSSPRVAIAARPADT